MSGPLMLDLAGTTLSADEAALLSEPQVGGLILFARNFVSVPQVSDLIRAIREVRPDMIVAVDQEGGRVQRFKTGLTRLPPLRLLGERHDSDPAGALAAARDWGWLMASEMRALDVDISFAPVLDLDFGRSQVIGNRAFHANPAVVAALAREYIAGMREGGMASTGKHFPGHGWVEADSHVDIPVDERGRESLFGADVIPFEALASDLDGIMPAHVVYRELDPQPAGFSRFWLQDILRRQLGFKGVIFSDDLAMEGAATAGGFPDRTRAALEAGCDMVLVCNHRDAALEVLAWLQQHPVAPNARITALRGTGSPSLEALRDDRRWQTTAAAMAAAMS